MSIMQDIYEYILQTKEVRQAHLMLNEPCVERGGPEKGSVSVYCKGLMAYFLNTNIPNGHKIYVCHACHNGKCAHPKHLYWGTALENLQDAVANGKKTPYQSLVEKHGLVRAKQIQSASAKSGKLRKTS